MQFCMYCSALYDCFGDRGGYWKVTTTHFDFSFLLQVQQLELVSEQVHVARVRDLDEVKALHAREADS